MFNCTRNLLDYWHLSPSLPTEKQSQCIEEYRLTHRPSPQGLFSWHRSTQPGVACITMVGETSHVTSISSRYFSELRQPMNWWCSIGTACVNPVIQMLCIRLKSQINQFDGYLSLATKVKLICLNEYSLWYKLRQQSKNSTALLSPLKSTQIETSCYESWLIQEMQHLA